MTEHEDIARRLRHEAQASAPADLLPAVMADVRADPRRSRQRRRWPAWPRWQPVAAWTAAAATLVALGFGIAHLPSSSSSSSSASESRAAAGVNSPALHSGPEGVPPEGQAFTVPQAAALSILGKWLPSAYRGLGPADRPQGIKVGVPADLYSTYAYKLRQAQLKATSTTNQGPISTVIVKLFRAHGR